MVYNLAISISTEFPKLSFLFHITILKLLGAPKSLQMVTAAMKLRLAPWKESYDQPRQNIKKQRHYFANKDPSSQGYGFPSSHVWM